ncbi:hypothetical protein RZO55_18565 [Clostridium boliviensis]|uniref:Uncharacterized protein n=1 Tax=Clostridium boliviensis TaxID=318465 RepID=A0ABU4GRF9_9CLOT|nr:hypothetical protein [Clostridium boliviensis]MDW2799582.1 hypothetical protein [Clostridium boliviensis]
MKVTTGKVYIGEEALKKLDEILKAQEEKEKKEKPNGDAEQNK